MSALNSRARRWWEQVGFHPFDPEDVRHPDLHLLTGEIEKTLRERRGHRGG